MSVRGSEGIDVMLICTDLRNYFPCILDYVEQKDQNDGDIVVYKEEDQCQNFEKFHNSNISNNNIIIMP